MKGLRLRTSTRLAAMLAAMLACLAAAELPGVAARQAGTVVTTLRTGVLTWPDAPEAAPGGDTRLPPWLPAANPLGGWYDLWGRSADPRKLALAGPGDLLALPELTWARLNPAPGVWDWSLVEEGAAGQQVGLRDLRRLGRRGILWFMAWREDDLPDWVRRKHGLRLLHYRDFDGRAAIWPVWRDGPRADLLAAVAEMGRRLADEPVLVQIPAIGNRSGEMYPGRGLLEALQADGCTMEGYRDFHLAWLDAWAAALPCERGIFASIDAPFDGRHRSDDADRSERAAYAAIVDRVLVHGLGSRTGGTDTITNHAANGWLLAIGDDGRASARHLPLPVFANEIEEFATPAFVYFEQMLLAGVALGCTHYLPDDALLLNLAGEPTLAGIFDQRYAALLGMVLRCAGWPAELAPQALVQLGELDLRDERVIDRRLPWPRARPRRVLANHAWLVQQVESDGCRTRPDLRRDWTLDRSDLEALRTAYRRISAEVPWSRADLLRQRLDGLDGEAATRQLCNGLFGLTLEDGVRHTWAGRRTDRAAGQTAIAFRCDPRFLPAAGMDAVVQVTWRSDGARWQLAWRDGSATRALAAPVTPADGALWTASFGLRGLVPDGRDGDLRLQHVGGGDLCVQQLRILRWTPPLAGASASAAALHAEADRLRARRHAAELEAMAEAAALHQAYAAERRAADPARVDSWKRRLHGLRERFMADLAAAGRAAAGRGLDLVDLRGRWDEAMDLAERGQAAAETRIAELETVLPP